MKRLLEYLTSRKSDNIYEGFYDDHILTDNVIEEGFWDFMSQLIKSLFGDASIETKNYGESIFAHGNNEYGKKYQNAIQKLLKEKNTKKFLESAEKTRKEWVENKTMEENESYAEMCFVFELKRKILVDNKKTNDVKLIEKQIEEYKKKAGDVLKKTQEKIKKNNATKKESNDNDNGAPSKEFGEAANKAFEEYKSEIEQLCKTGNTTPEQLKNVVFQISKSDKMLSTINDSKTIFALCIMGIGAKLAESFDGDYNVIAMFMGTVGALAEQKKLN